VQVSSRLRFEPFFVPRVPILRDAVRTPGLQRVGVEIFDQRPGQGLAFLVCTGSVRDFPIELSTFLLDNEVSPVQVGEFLGEDFSLSQTLRLEFINSVRLTGTGVVSCLAKVFSRVHIPSDMQKIDRLLEAVAQIWWRQHERLQDYPQHIAGDQDNDGGEVEGMQLMRQFPNYGVLHQLMFSTVLLHWSLYAPLPPSQRITLEQWLEMNVDLGGSGAMENISQGQMQRLQRMIYNAINCSFLPQLQIWSAPSPSSLGKLPSSPGCIPKKKGDHPDAKEEVLEGWALLVGGGFPRSGNAPGSTVTYSHVRSIHCEKTSTGSAASPANSRQSRPQVDAGPPAPKSSSRPPAAVAYTFSPPPPAVGKTKSREVPDSPDVFASVEGVTVELSSAVDKVWLTLRQSLLFFATKPTHWAPYAFVHLSQVMVSNIDSHTCIISLVPDKQVDLPVAAKDTKEEEEAVPSEKKKKVAAIESAEPLVQIIFLLPDGRWQAIDVPRLEVKISDPMQLEGWVRALADSCGKDAAGCELEQSEI